MEKSYSASYAAAGVDITAGYRAVELMKKHVARTRNEGCLDDVGGFGGCFGLPIAGMEEPVLVSGTDGCGTKVKLAILSVARRCARRSVKSLALLLWVSRPLKVLSMPLVLTDVSFAPIAGTAKNNH